MDDKVLSSVEFVTWINGKEHRLKKVDPAQTLLSYLRKCELTGTKLGCGEGGCGACTVVVSRLWGGRIIYYSVNACLMPLLAVHEKSVLTVEGIGSPERPHIIQSAMGGDGSQCGFCTPGFVMSLYAAWRNGNLDKEIPEEAIDGNLCRCTGYRPIIAAARKICALGNRCCQNIQPSTNPDCNIYSGDSTKDIITNQPNDREQLSDKVQFDEVKKFTTNEYNNITIEQPISKPSENFKKVANHPTKECSKQFKQSRLEKFDPTQEIIFPPKLRVLLESTDQSYVSFKSSNVTWHRPVTLNELLTLKAKYPLARIVFGNTEIGVEVGKTKRPIPILIYASDIFELDYIRENDGEHIEVGAGVTLSNLKIFCKAQMVIDQRYQGLGAIYEMLRWFAGTQIRNVASWVGNVATASPISDLNPVWAALNAKLIITSIESGERIQSVSTFFQGYRVTSLKSHEVIKSILIPYTKPNEYTFAYKQSKRRDDDIAIVNATFRVLLGEAGDDIVKDCSMAIGGMGPTTLLSKRTKDALIGRKITCTKVLDETVDSLREEFSLPPDAIGGMSEYRNALVPSLFFKFFLKVNSQRGIELDPSCMSLLNPRQHQPSMASQYYPKGSCDDNREELRLTGQPLAHLSGLKHATGNAQYVDDLPQVSNELYAGLVQSIHSHAIIKSIDPSKALSMPGVVDIITWKDVPGNNQIGPVLNDEKVLAEDYVTSCGQIIAIILAIDKDTAQRAARLVTINYEDVHPTILTIDEAIKANSFHPITRRIDYGNVEEALTGGRECNSSTTKVSGTIYIGGQEHFYLETQAALVIPSAEDNSYDIISSTQNPSEGQHFVSQVLGIPSHKITCRVKRIGGGFGGKETRSSFLVAALAVASHKVKQPVRCMLDRDEDMIFSGQRHPFKLKYVMGADKDGYIKGADLQLFSNGGHSLDLSAGVMERALTHIDNGYYFPALRAVGRICKTNLPSNTAFRGFGGPQGNFFCETMLTHLSQVLKVDIMEIRRRNLYKKGDETPFRMVLEDAPLPTMWDQLYSQTDYEKRKEECIKFNEGNRWTKRGIAMVPTKFGIAFGVKFLNQAGALVHVYKDGSVLLVHGGVEMGQGLHTKMCQIAADALGVELNDIFHGETSTNTIPNTSPSAASSSSDLNGMAVLRACETIKERLKPLRESYPSLSFKELVSLAYKERVDLSARGFYATPGVGFDWEGQQGRLYNYFTFGVAASEVEIDVLTGDYKILKSDILMDLGRSLNPSVDIGQIEGAFVQGIGLFTIEQPLYLNSGILLNRGPGGYKIPSATDIPKEFNVTLFPGNNPLAIHGSRAVGEPPLFLAASAFFAIHDAVLAARRDSEMESIDRLESNRTLPPLILDSPATSERIRLACADYLVSPLDDSRELKGTFSNPKAWCFEV